MITTSLVLVAGANSVLASHDNPPVSLAAFDVPATGQVVTVYVPAGLHVITVSGTYSFTNDPTFHACSWADADYANVAGCSAPCTDAAVLDLLVNGASPWSSPCDPATHTYETTYSCGSAWCRLDFRIHDTDYSDNSGSLHVVVV